MTDTLVTMVTNLAKGKAKSSDLIERSLSEIFDENGEGSRTFLSVFGNMAKIQAETADRLMHLGYRLPPLTGIPISVKDLFDITDQITLAGSKVRASCSPALADAKIISLLRAAGAIIIGRTNMTEFAFSGLGVNPHYNTPRNPWDRSIGKIPGGSSSGAAVSVTDGMAAASIGTDTGGSVRIPAALCGLTGFKPTASRVSTTGAFPLSTTLDSIGPLAKSVECCALIDQVISGTPVEELRTRSPETISLAVPQNIVLDEMDSMVAARFEFAVSKLSAMGARITDIPFNSVLDIPKANEKGGFAASEAYATLRHLLQEDEELFDPRVAVRIKRGANMSAVDYIELLKMRELIQHNAASESYSYDAILMPTVPIVAPAISSVVESDEFYHEANMLMLRNCSIGNFLNRCAVTIPIQEPGSGPVGLMLMGETMEDRKILEIASGIQKAFEL